MTVDDSTSPEGAKNLVPNQRTDNVELREGGIVYDFQGLLSPTDTFKDYQDFTLVLNQTVTAKSSDGEPLASRQNRITITKTDVKVEEVKPKP